MGVNTLPKTATRQRRGCNLNPGPSAPESRTLTTRLLKLTKYKAEGSEKLEKKDCVMFKGASKFLCLERR